MLHLVADLVADTLGGGVPSLRALTLETGKYLYVLLREIVAGQPRNTHLSLTPKVNATFVDALLLATVYKGMEGRLQSLDLRPLSPQRAERAGGRR